MHLKHFLLALPVILLAACSSSKALKYDNTFAGVGGDQPLALPARISLFAPSRIDVPDPKLTKQFLTRGNEVEADSFAAGISKSLASKGIQADLHRYNGDSYSETADLETMVSTICSKDTSRYSLVIGTLRLAADPELATKRDIVPGLGNSLSGGSKWTTADRPTLMTEFHLYDHKRGTIARSIRFGSEGPLKHNVLLDLTFRGAAPMMESIFKELADTVRVR